MKAVILLLFLLIPAHAVADGYVYVEVMQGAKVNGNWEGNYPTTVHLGFRSSLNDRWYVGGGYEHASNIGRGCDLQLGSRCTIRSDNRSETHRDQFYLSLGYKFYSW